MSNHVTESYVLVDNKYKLLEEVGDGSTCTVFKALATQDSSIVALKIASSQPDRSFDKEYEASRLFDHPGILKFVDYVPEGLHSTYTDGTYESTHQAEYLVSQFLEGSDLFNFVKSHGAFRPAVCRAFTKQLLDALEHMHSRGYAHNDLKTENISPTADG